MNGLKINFPLTRVNRIVSCNQSNLNQAMCMKSGGRAHTKWPNSSGAKSPEPQRELGHCFEKKEASKRKSEGISRGKTENLITESRKLQL